MPNNIIYRSDLLPNIEFNSYEEAANAEKEYENKRIVSKFNDDLSKLIESSGKVPQENLDAMNYAKEYEGKDGKDWLTDPNYDPNKGASGQILNEMTARGQSIAPDARQQFTKARNTLAPYLGSIGGAKDVLSTFEKQADQEYKDKALNQKGTSGLGGSVFDKQQEWNQPDKVNKLKGMIQLYSDSGLLTPDERKQYESAIDNGYAYEVGKKLIGASSGITEKRGQKELDLSYNPQIAVATEQATGPIKTQNAANTAAASEKARSGASTEINKTAIPGFKPIEGAKLTDESVAKVKALSPDIETMKQLSKELADKYDKMGNVFTGDDAADYRAKVRNLQLLAKSPSLYNLGVLAGPDLMLLEQTIPDPSSFKEGVSKQVLGDLSVKFKNFRDLVDLRGNQFYQVNGYERDEKPKKPASTSPSAKPQGAKKKVYNEETGAFEWQ